MRLLLAALLALAATVVEAALPEPPFELTLSPSSLLEGQTTTVRVTARPGGTAGERYDVYLQMASSEEAAFLTPEGTWAPRPVPYVRGMATTDSPVVRPWAGVWPPGRHALGLVVVAASGDPLARSEWSHRPSVAWVRIAPLRSEGGGPAAAIRALLAAAAAVAIVLVWWAGRRPASACGP